MAIVKSSTTADVRELLKAGAHFGHKISRWNPKMKPYIYTERGGIYIIDLLQTVGLLENALAFVNTQASKGKQILFVGTKRHIRDALKAAAESAGMPYIIGRWYGGSLTNFDTIKKRTKLLVELEEGLASGKLAEDKSKRELGEAKVLMAKLNNTLGGLKTMTELPAAVFVTDVINDNLAVREAGKLGIPVIGIVDTNSDPTGIDYLIPANDDAVSAITYIAGLLAEAIKAGKANMRVEPVQPVAEPAKKAAADSKAEPEAKPAQAAK